MNLILFDTSFIVAFNNPKDSKHVQALQFLTSSSDNFLIPEVVLTEATFLLGKAGGLPAVTGFLRRLVETEAVLQSVGLIDLNRAKEIMLTYPESRLDFVDCCLMALSERLNITHICTFDRRDFSIFRPKHCAYLELLP
jgi:predicted nucleic acid-binding protein